ncbi:aminotransferase class V-fold PLP-dependent enzyme [Granulosicoccus sp.]|nr:aminotransferase class V-fold PLP-dependent enzyme [Granulosicoccus sp.]MDB4223428.1 aminotransferase class V-fold PLP-dependent enzyme [Granulosicoccus sp.]
MPALFDNVDPDGLLEYSVVYTDRALNHMSAGFQGVMCDISQTLKQAYNAHKAIIVPGSGTFGMEAVARQFASDQKCLVIRNGWFSYRWTQIFEAGSLPSESTVMKAQRALSNVIPAHQSPFQPAPIDEVVAAIKSQRPAVVFAPHVETSAGMILPDDYIAAVSEAVHSVGGLMVLDCIASGTIWVDMQKTGVDILISAPQKGWSGPPCCGLVMLNELARERINSTKSSSFSIDLKKWLDIMETYESGAHAYHSTMPTESLRIFRDVMKETTDFGLGLAHARQQELGDRVRALIAEKGFHSVAASGFEAPSVIVSYTDNPAIQNGSLFKQVGVQVAGGVPLMCDEGDDFKTFRVGLFGLDKLKNVDRTVDTFATTLDAVLQSA